jgi:hypothetical protein
MPVYYHHTNGRSLAQQRDAENRAIATDRLVLPIRVFGIGQNVRDMNVCPFK